MRYAGIGGTSPFRNGTPTFSSGTPTFCLMGVLNSCFQNSSEFQLCFCCLAIEAGFYSDMVECLPVDPATWA